MNPSTLIVISALVAADPLRPEETIASLRVAKEFIVELVAAEPVVQDPVAIAWDERGRMFVVEMTDYPTEKFGGRIKVLEDVDGDGRMDRARLFADQLPFPTSVLPSLGGVYISAAPNIWFLKDTNGDLVADEREPVIRGFGEGNQQLRVNGLVRGIDNWIYGANGRSDGELRLSRRPQRATVSIRNRDFRFNSNVDVVEPVAGFSQFGHAFDDWGNRFLSWNTVHIRHVVLAEHYLTRHGGVTIGEPVAHIADHGDAGQVFPLTAPQPRFNREPPGYFNASCGLTIERGGLFPSPYRGSAFVCEPLFNIVHRDELLPVGPTFVARRGHHEQTSEFIASTDPWFRPVKLVSGPDGALYIADFYREWVEHPAFVPDELERGIAFRSGFDRGRIYRVRPVGIHLFAIPNLADVSSHELVELLSHHNGWRRDTAQRLLIERGDHQVAPALRSLATDGADPLGRLHALWTLDGLGLLDDTTLLAALRNKHAGVREHAVRLAESRLTHRAIVDRLTAMTDDENRRVRCQLACTLGELDGTSAIDALVRIALRDGGDRWVQIAVLSAVGGRAAEFLARLMRQSGRLHPDALDLLTQAAAHVGFQGNESEVRALLKRIDVPGEQTPAIASVAVLAGLLDGNSRRRARVVDTVNSGPDLRPWFESAQRLARDRNVASRVRVDAIALLGHSPWTMCEAMVRACLHPSQPDVIQQAVITTLGRRPEPDAARYLIEYFVQATATIRVAIMEALLRDRSHREALLAALEAGTIQPTDLELHWRAQLLEIPDSSLRRRAERLLKDPRTSTRADVVRRYTASRPATLDRKRGGQLFAKHCAVCHRLRGEGVAVGPDLSGLITKSPEQLVVDILDPNREVLPNFVQFAVETKLGVVLNGILVSESETAIRLRRAQAVEDFLLRSEIELLRSTGRSLMPEGFEQLLTPEELGDLVAFLREPL